MSEEATFTQAEFARAGCTSSRGCRFWEDQGLLGVVARSEAGVRRYTVEQMRYAAIIAAAQFGGWQIEQIKQMIENYDVDPSVHDALVTRLADQVRAAARLADQLPKPRHLETPSLEYDL